MHLLTTQGLLDRPIRSDNPQVDALRVFSACEFVHHRHLCVDRRSRSTRITGAAIALIQEEEKQKAALAEKTKKE
jgi:hypothetical protein